MKRFLSILLTAAMLVSAAPVTFADDIADNTQVVTTGDADAENLPENAAESDESVDKDEDENIDVDADDKDTDDKDTEDVSNNNNDVDNVDDIDDTDDVNNADDEQTSIKTDAKSDIIKDLAPDFSVKNTNADNGIALFADSTTEAEVEYSIRCQSTNWDWKSFTGTLKAALQEINSSGNAGTIKLLKNIDIENTIGVSSEYPKIQISDIDGGGFKITRASGFTGTMIELGAYKCTVHNLTLDGKNVGECDPIIVAPAVGNSKGTHLILQDVTLCNNTNSAIKAGYQVEGTNVKIENCSAKKGGAIYFESGAISAASAEFTDSVFLNNSADTGSVAYAKSTGDNVFGVKFAGCTFSNNKYVADDSNTDKYTKNTLIYACTDTDKISWYNYVIFAGNTLFSNNNVGADVMLDGGLGNMTIGGSDVVSGGLRIGDNFSTDSVIKVSVGSYERGTYKDGGLVVYLNSTGESKFSLVDVNGGTKVANNGKLFTVKQKETSNYLVIGSIRKVMLNYNGKIKSSCNTISEFNSAENGAVNLNVTPAFVLEQKQGSSKMVDKAVENVMYTLTAKAGNSKISEFYIKYSKTGTLNDPKIEGTIDTTGSTASLILTPEILSDAADGNPYVENTIAVYVKYEILAQPITIASVTGGTISTDPAGSANVGSTVTLTATPDSGYEFESWNVYKTDDPNTTVAVTDNKFTMPDYPVTVSAVFTRKAHNVTTEVAGEKDGGTVTIDKTPPVNVGETVTVTAAANANYKLTSLKVVNDSDNSEISTTQAGGNYTFTMPDADVTVTATFAKEQFTVTKSATEHGTIEILSPNPDSDGNYKLEWGANVKINVKADDFYDIAGVTINDVDVTALIESNGDYSFVMPKNDVTIGATFKKAKYKITGIGENVIFDIPTDDKYDWGDTVEFTVTPNKWYVIDNVTIPGIDLTNIGNGKYSFVMPSHDVTITVAASKPIHTVIFDTKGGNPVQSVTVENGDSITKVIPVWAGRGFAGWYTDESYTTKYDFSTPVENNMTLYARWFLWGDVNGDQVIDSYDAALIRRCMIGLAPYEKMTQKIAGFVTGFADGRSNPDSSDAATIRRLCIGFITRFKVEDETSTIEFDLDTNSIVNN